MQGKVTATWGDYAWFSNWRAGIKCDYSTNPACSYWYSGYMPKGMRGDDRPLFLKYLSQDSSDSLKDTLIVGADYYALMQSATFFPIDLLQQYAASFNNGKVHYFRVYRTKGGIAYERVL